MNLANLKSTFHIKKEKSMQLTMNGKEKKKSHKASLSEMKNSF